ncbi:M36 family metallopeptidase [Agromyces sp. MMS24-K17]|uniref:M36 family metallopeptidase n=1 Tax=Agromyces sp. MMS24-K17 TaxID=3372850 RepID=UPI0037545DBC
MARPIGIVAVLGAFALVLSQPLAAVAAPGASPGAAPPPGGASAAALGFDDGLLVRTDEVGDVLSVLNPVGALTGPSAAAPLDIVLGYLGAHADAFGLGGGGLASLVPDAPITDPSGVTYVILRQQVQGLPVHQAVFTASVAEDGRLVHVGGTAADVPGDAARAAPAEPDVTAAEAIAEAASEASDAPVVAAEVPREAQTTEAEAVEVPNTLADAGLANPTPLKAEQRWFPTDHGRALTLAWVTDVELSGQVWVESIVDAATGEVLDESSRYAHLGPEGDVFDEEHPDASGASRELHPFSGINGTWVADDTTSGNNVDAYRDLDDDDANNEYQPVTPASGDPGYQVFDYAFTDAWRTNADGADASLDADLDAIITQLFYYTNVMHDYTYELGFTEAWRNFQVDNFGNGGSDGDPVLAEAQDGWDFGCEDDDSNPVRCMNNANFGTPGDGSSPRMQMYMWSPPNRPYRDGSMDGDVIAHEFGHGVSTRLVGGGSFDYGDDQTGALGEGWSDVLSFLKWDDTMVGEYVTGNTTTGIRSVAYDTSPLVYSDYNPYDPAGDGSPHGNGTIWATMVYAVRAFIGLQAAEQLVIDGMKATDVGAKPTFVDARNGLIAADVATNGGSHVCAIWSAFAQRGLGANAVAAGTNGHAAQVDDTTLPAGCAPTADAGGPYATIEGTDAPLDGSGSSAGSDPSAGAISAWEWDLDADGQYDDAFGFAPSFDRVGQDGSYPIGLRVTDLYGNVSTDTATVEVANVAPTVTIDPVPALDEAARTATIRGVVSDPGWLEDLSATIDFDDGAGPQPLAGAEEQVRPDATLAFETTYDFGDDGLFEVEVCGLDDDTSTCATVDVDVANIDPSITIDTSGTQAYDGVEAFVLDAGGSVTIPLDATDPGSDDLELTWDWDDGTTDTEVSLVNPPVPDPLKSPTVQPRAVGFSADHVYADACLYDFVATAADDDGGSATDEAAIVVVGDGTKSKQHGWWLNQVREKKNADFTEAELECYLDIAVFFSTVFDTPLDRDDAVAIFHSPPNNDANAQFDQFLLAAWLNFANGSVGLATPVKVDGVWTTWGTAMLALEDVRTNPASTPQDVRQAKGKLAGLVTTSG